MIALLYFLDIAYCEQATKEEEDRVGGDQGIRVVVDRFSNSEVGVFMFLKLLVSNAR